jgi:isoamylase
VKREASRTVKRDGALPPLHGAHWDGCGVTFSVHSNTAEAIELCLFDTPEGPETTRHQLVAAGSGVWSLRLEDAQPGLLYGYRVHGPFDPARGHRANPAKLLVDPWARSVTGEPKADPSLSGGEEAPDGRDSASAMPRSAVIDPTFDWEGDAPPCIAWSDTVLYEAHVRGLTRLHPEVPEALRGTYLGVVQPAVIAHLRALGVTTVELMPVQQIATEPALASTGRRNYFGYSPLAPFAPHAGYAAGGWQEATRELKTLVRELHRNGLEVVLDVVFNHTPEGDHRGPTLSLRGFDNAGWYRLNPDDRRRFADFTGCGNTLDFRQPEVRRWALDCLSHWSEELHVDGFRFDLAPVLGRAPSPSATAPEDPDGFDSAAPFFSELAARPELARVKLIAEPWDAGPGGYRLGLFPAGWSEWNDRFRDGARAFWRGDRGAAQPFRAAFQGSERVFAPQRPASASVHYVTCHDGFTLADLVSYQEKRNWENGEENRDGPSHNLSRNWGTEGPTEDPSVRALRGRVQRAFLATLALARGVPMLSHGDELGRSQRGNNNPYCHDSELTWLDWERIATADRDVAELLEFARSALALRREWEVVRREAWPGAGETRWLGPHGGALAEGTPAALAKIFALQFSGERRLLLLFNGDEQPRFFRLPRPGAGHVWRRRLDSARPGRAGSLSGAALNLAGHSLVVFAEEALPSAQGSGASASAASSPAAPTSSPTR